MWTRSFLIIWSANFLNHVVYLLLMIVMAKIATDRFGASSTLAGLSAGVFVVGAFLTRPSLGKRIHMFGQVKTVYVGSFLNLALTLCYFAASNIGLLVIIRFVHGAVHAIAALAIGTIAAGVVPRERYGEGMGYLTLGQTLSTAVGPFAGLLLVRSGGFNPIIITCSVISLLGLVILPLLGVKDLPLTSEQVAETKGFKLDNYIVLRAVPVGLAIMLSYLCYSSVSSFLALYSEKTQLTGAATVFFLVYALVVFLTRRYVGRRFDAKGENSVLYPSIVILALGLLALALAKHASVLLLSAAAIGLGFGTIQACGRALTNKLTPLHRMGQATSTFYIFADIGLGVGPLICGLLIPAIGYRGMYGVMAGVAMLALLFYYALHGSRAAVGDEVAHR